jgi:aspartate racemase
MHIGLIGGVGPAATEYYYRGLINRHATSATPLDLTIVHADVRELGRNIANNDARNQAAIFLRLVQRLAAAGADAVAITSMGGHFCIAELLSVSPLPIINAIPEVNAEISARNLKRIGILGTRLVMESGLYGGIASVQIVLPEGDALDLVAKTYMEIATAGRVTEAQRRIFFAAGRQLCATQGADAIMLGGTDLFLAFDGQHCGFPVIDCADIHIAAIHRRSTPPTA